LLCGCPDPNTYTTPRTLPRGRVQGLIAPEGIAVVYPTRAPSGGTASPQNVILPAPPTLGLRVGGADNLDVGVRLDQLQAFAFDFKLRLFQGRFDAAIDPGAQVCFLDQELLGHLPLLLAWNVAESVSLVVAPGLMFASGATSTTQFGSLFVMDGVSAPGTFGRVGGGVNLRLGNNFALQPEVTGVQQFGVAGPLVLLAGVGILIGAQPDYSDLGPHPPAASQ
jgi:hypothetical protein